MAHWFEKDERRRFPRTDLSLRVFIRPILPITGGQILAYKANYLPTSIQSEIKKIEKELKESMAKIQEQREVLIPSFLEAISLCKDFADITQEISKGNNPAYNKEKISTLQNLAKGFQKIIRLKTDGPKTYHFFEMMNVKFIAYSQAIINILKNANSQEFLYSFSLQSSFEMDKVISKFKAEKYQHMPLTKSLHLLFIFINLHLNCFIELLKEHQPKPAPQKWTEYYTGLSACGLDIKLPKDYPLNTKLEIGLFFPESKKSILLKGSLNRSIKCTNSIKQINVIDFDFPSSQEQRFIESQQQIYQINRCILGL